jgi:hypothetical protein
MATDNDHIEALRNRLLGKLKDKENEVASIKEMIRVLGEAPGMLGGKVLSEKPVQQKAPVRYNRNLAELVRSLLNFIRPCALRPSISFVLLTAKTMTVLRKLWTC